MDGGFTQSVCENAGFRGAPHLPDGFCDLFLFQTSRTNVKLQGELFAGMVAVYV